MVQLASIADAVSWELLFWLPTLTDVLLLIVIYGNFSYYGVIWFLKSVQQKRGDNNKKNDDDDDDELLLLSENNLPPAVHQVWELAMMAYSAYAVLLPLAVYWCVVRPELRPSFCWAMTALMVLKVQFLRQQEKKRRSAQQGSSGKAVVGNETQNKEKLNTLYYFYFPTYGGYAILKTFVL